MSKRTFATVPAARAALAFLAIFLFAQAPCHAEPVTAGIEDSGGKGPAVVRAPTKSHQTFRVQGTSQELDMVVDTSRIVTLDKGIPKVLVNDPGTVKVTPLAADRIRVAALRAGVTQIRLWDQDGEVYTVDVSVHNDARELETLLREQFPDCTLRVRRLNKSVVISGRVDTSETLKDVVEIVEARFPKVIRDITVVGTPAVKLHVALLDLSRTKMESQDIGWGKLIDGDLTGLSCESNAIVDDRDALADFVNRLKRQDVAKVLASPTLVAVSGRPANFKVGEEVPVSAGEGTFEFKFVGTQVEFIPRVLGNGKLRLQTHLDIFNRNSRRDETTGRLAAPPYPCNWSHPGDLVVDFRPGQSLILVDRPQERGESKGRAIGLLAELPLVGSDLARKMGHGEKIQTVLIVTPQWQEAEAAEPESAEKRGAVAVISDLGGVQTK